MSVLGKLAFWKKESDPFGGGGADPFGKDMGLQGSDPFGGAQADQFGQPFTPQQPVNDIGMGQPYEHVTHLPTQDPYGGGMAQQQSAGKDMEIISAKLDTIRVMVDSLGQKVDSLSARLASIEAIAREPQQKW